MDTRSAVASRYNKRLSAHFETVVAQLKYVQEQLAMDHLIELDALRCEKQVTVHESTIVDVDCMAAHSYDSQESFPSGAAWQQGGTTKFQKLLADRTQNKSLQGCSQARSVAKVELPPAGCDGDKVSTARIQVADEPSADVHALLQQHQLWMLQTWMLQLKSMITEVVNRTLQRVVSWELSKQTSESGLPAKDFDGPLEKYPGKASAIGSSVKGSAATLNMGQERPLSPSSHGTKSDRFSRLHLKAVSTGGFHSSFSARTEASRPRRSTIKSFEVFKACHKMRREASFDSDTRRRNDAVQKARVNFEVIDSRTVESESLARKKSSRCIVEHRYFETFCGFLIITNALFVGVQVVRNADNRDTGSTVAMHIDLYVVSFVYTVLFMLEFSLRVCADGYRFFGFNTSWFWNYLDTIIVPCTIFELVLDTLVLAYGEKNDSLVTGNIKTVRMLRIVRLFRVVRITRLLRFFHELRVLVLSIMASSKGLVWVSTLLLGLLYMTGILFTSAVTDFYIEARTSESDVPLWTDLDSFWGTLPRSMFTLFKSISGGLDWHDCVYPLYILGPHWVAVFVFFIFVSYFSILNVVTGIFCQGAIDRTQQDQDMLIANQITNRKKFQRQMHDLFHKLDVNDCGLLNILEFEENINRPDIEAFFLSLDVDTSDAWALFKILDSEEDNEIDIDEFVVGLMKLKGRVKKCDIIQVEVALDKINAKQSMLIDSISEIREEIKNMVEQDAGRDAKQSMLIDSISEIREEIKNIFGQGAGIEQDYRTKNIPVNFASL